MAVIPPRAGAGAIRDPRDAKQRKGQILNPPRWQKLGGMSGPGALDKMAMPVEKPVPGSRP